MKCLALFAIGAALAAGQCSMCFRNAEAQNRGRAEALNRGIAVLLIPMLGGSAAIAILAYKRRARTMPTAGVSD